MGSVKHGTARDPKIVVESLQAANIGGPDLAGHEKAELEVGGVCNYDLCFANTSRRLWQTGVRSQCRAPPFTEIFQQLEFNPTKEVSPPHSHYEVCIVEVIQMHWLHCMSFLISGRLGDHKNRSSSNVRAQD